MLSNALYAFTDFNIKHLPKESNPHVEFFDDTVSIKKIECGVILIRDGCYTLREIFGKGIFIFQSLNEIRESSDSSPNFVNFLHFLTDNHSLDVNKGSL